MQTNANHTMICRRNAIGALVGACMGFPAIVRAAPTHKIGISLPLSGVQAEVGQEMRQGYELAFSTAGMPFQLVFVDDASKAENAAENMRSFAGDKLVIASSGIVGTPHAQAALPVATSAEIPVLGIRSGARLLRNGKNSAYHLRSSFEDELTYLAKDAVGRGQKKLAIVYSEDSFGNASRGDLGFNAKSESCVKKLLSDNNLAAFYSVSCIGEDADVELPVQICRLRETSIGPER